MRKLIPIIICFALLLGGCGSGRGLYANYRAIGELLTVEALGLDAGPEGGVVLTAATGSADDSVPPLVLRAAGDGILAAMDALRALAPGGQLFFAHTRFLVVGEGLARRGLAPLLDYVERDMQLRTGAQLLVLHAAEAGALLTGAAGGDAPALLDALARRCEASALCRIGSVREAARALDADGAALLGAAELRPAEGGVFPDGAGLEAVPAGYAVVRGDGLSRWLRGAEAEAAGLLRGGAPRLRRRVGDAVLELDASRLRRRGDTAELRLRCTLAEWTAPEGGAPDAAGLDALCDRCAAELEAELAALLALSREPDADFLGLGALRAVRVRAVAARSGDLALAPGGGAG